MTPETITILLVGYPETDFPPGIVTDLERQFAAPVLLEEGHWDLSEFFDPARRQYNANLLLEEIERLYASDRGKVIGLFNVDLFIPILTFIYGQAFLNGRSGLVSGYRLRNERYGLKPDEQLFYDRLKKEIVHELGHAFGLIHCQNPACVMHSSTYVEDIDQKSARFCAKCSSQLTGR